MGVPVEDAPARVLRVAAPVLGFDPEHLEAFRYDPPFLRGWTFWLVSDACLPPGEVYVAEREGQAVLVTPENSFTPLVESEPVNIENAQDAITYVRMFIRVTRPGLQIVDSFSDIPGLVDEAAARVTVELAPPSATASQEGGWEVMAFLNELDELDLGRFRIAPGGDLTASFERLADGISIFSAWE